MSVFALSTNEDKLDLVQEQHRLSLFWIVLIIYTHYIVSIAHSIISLFAKSEQAHSDSLLLIIS